jgi:hypothetical protein
MLGMANIPEAFPDLEFQRLKNEVDEARISCHRARKALSTHQETTSPGLLNIDVALLVIALEHPHLR